MIVVRIARGFHWLGRGDVPGIAPKLRRNCSEMRRIPSEFASEGFFHFSPDRLEHDQEHQGGFELPALSGAALAALFADFLD